MPRGLFALLLAGAFLVYASANSLVPVAAEARAELGLHGSSAAIFLLPFAAGFGVGSVLWLALARRRSPRLLLPMSLAAAALASLVLPFTSSPEVAVVARTLVGVASAGYPSVAQAVISRAAAPETRGRLIGVFVVAVVTGSFVGQAVAGALADWLSVDAAILAVCVVAPLVVAGALWLRLPDERPAKAGPRPGAPGGRLMLALWPVLAVAALSFGAYWLLLSELPEVLRDERYALTAAEAGALPMLGLAGALTASVTGRLSDRIGQRAPMVGTLAVGLVGLVPTLAVDAPLWLFAAGYSAFLAAYWGYLPAASQEVTARSGPEDRQAALMAFYAAMWIGAAVAPAAGVLLDGWNAAALVALAAWALAVAIAAATFTSTASGPSPRPAVRPEGL
ncbi:MAG: transporter, family, putative rane transport protein [Miltoncostaeaceae bacterium]|jgi:predicted MFS family arabinose efflux permease|nr:transporter, family, putative rane transport protein [Miltoncostaeaceae bacterium]